MMFALFVFLIAISVNGIALAQTFQSPQIPGYDLPPDEQDKANNMVIPAEPGGNQGEPQGLPPADPTPQPQPDYGLVFFLAIIIGIPVIGLTVIWVAWAISKKRKASPT